MLYWVFRLRVEQLVFTMVLWLSLRSLDWFEVTRHWPQHVSSTHLLPERGAELLRDRARRPRVAARRLATAARAAAARRAYRAAAGCAAAARALVVALAADPEPERVRAQRADERALGR
jgi:hypothetical protein